MDQTIADFLSQHGDTVTLKTRTLGTRDSTTGHPSVTWSSGTSIKAMILSSRAQRAPYMEHAQEVGNILGEVDEQRWAMYTQATFSRFDRVVWQGSTFEITSDPIPVSLGGSIAFYKANLVRLRLNT